MPASQPTNLSDIAEIQRQMAQIRHDMHQEVRGAVKGAQLLVDWRSLVKNHPWLSISLASMAGYAIVPRRHSISPIVTSMELPRENLLMTGNAPAQAQQTRRTGWSIIGTAFSLLAPVAVRVAQNYALGHLEQWLSQHPLPPSAGSPGLSTRDSGRPASAGPANRLREYG
jgi:hypothetical protein